MSSLRMTMFVAVLLMMLLFLQYRLWFESGGIREMLQLKKSLTQQVDSNAILKKQNDELLHEIKQIKTSPDAIESRARDELGMIKRNEVFYQVIKNEKMDDDK